MQLLYNPGLMSEDEIKATFVAREPLIESLLKIIKHQPDGAGIQHVLLIAGRGMGKTTTLLMLQPEIKRRTELAARWQVVKFNEESYGIYDLADFWLEIINYLSSQTNDEKLRAKAAEIKTDFKENSILQEAAFALIKDWRQKHKKRLILLIDNFDQILEQINDERDNARLRDVLMNDGTLMIVGTATTIFHEVKAYNQPLYNFFKIYNLEKLNSQQIDELLRRRAEFDRLVNYQEKFLANKSLLRALEHYTSGNPRLLLMLYRITIHSDITEVREGLKKLLDEVTPYYKAKMEILPAQQRKILDYIARESANTSEGLTPTGIAKDTRLPVNQVSAQLKRLSELGYVHAANIRGRSSYYMLSEPLYAVWYQMRFKRDQQTRMEWLTDFLKVWYEAKEIQEEAALAGAMAVAALLGGNLMLAIKQYDRALAKMSDSYKDQFGKAVALGRQKRYQEALANCEKVLKINAKFPDGWHYRGLMLMMMGKYKEAIKSYDRTLALEPEFREAWFNRGNALSALSKYEEAMASYDQILKTPPTSTQAWYNHGITHLMKFFTNISLNKIELARYEWHEALNAAKYVEIGKWRNAAAKVLLSITDWQIINIAHELIAEAGLTEKLLPLVRAIAYLQTRDANLIEKLSPEIKGIVEDIVQRFQKNKSLRQSGG